MSIFNFFKKKSTIPVLSEEEQLRLKRVIEHCDAELAKNEFTPSNIDVIIDELTPFQLSTYSNCVDLIRLFIELGADVNKRYPDNNLALIIACGERRYEVAKLLLENGANPNLINDNLTGPIWYATTGNDLEMVELLLEYNVDPFKDSGNGISSYQVAKTMGLTEIVELMESVKKD